VLTISDVSVKNNIPTLVSYIRRGHEIIAKAIHYTMNVLSIEAELFAIRCGISRATQDVEHIVIITDAIPAAK